MDGLLRLLTRPFVLGVTLATLAACSRPVLLEPTFESDDALARAVLDGIARKDGPGLLGLSVSKDEFENLVWPTLPISRPEVGMPLAYVWQDNFTKSRAYLAQTVERYGGRRYDLVDVEFDGETTEYGSYSVSRETILVVRDERQEERHLRLFGSVIHQNGRSKVFSYIVD